MTCGKCKHEFCWNCHGNYFGYTHEPDNKCELVVTARFLNLFLIVPMMAAKLSFVFMAIWYCIYYLVFGVFWILSQPYCLYSGNEL